MTLCINALKLSRVAYGVKEVHKGISRANEEYVHKSSVSKHQIDDKKDRRAQKGAKAKQIYGISEISSIPYVFEKFFHVSRYLSLKA